MKSHDFHCWTEPTRVEEFEEDVAECTACGLFVGRVEAIYPISELPYPIEALTPEWLQMMGFSMYCTPTLWEKLE